MSTQNNDYGALFQEYGSEEQYRNYLELYQKSHNLGTDHHKHYFSGQLAGYKLYTACIIQMNTQTYDISRSFVLIKINQGLFSRLAQRSQQLIDP